MEEHHEKIQNGTQLTKMKLETTNEIQNWKQNIAQQQKLETNCNIEMKMNLQIKHFEQK